MKYKVIISKLCKIIYIFLLPILLAGCWGYSELNETGIVLATGIDKVGDQEYEVTVLSIAPIGSGGGMQQIERSNAWIGSARGLTPMDASKNLKKKATKKLTWVQNDILIIGEAAAREGISEIIDFLGRNIEIRLNSHFIISEGKAGDIFKIPSDIENNLHSEIKGIIDNSGQWSRSYVPDLREFIQEYSLIHMGSVAGRIGYIEQEKNTFSTNRENYMEFIDVEGKHRTLVMSGAAAFKKGKLIGFLDDVETKGYSWITGKANTGTLILARQGKKIIASMEAVVIDSSIEPEINGGEIIIKVKVYVTGRLMEEGVAIELSNPENIREMEAAFADEITRDIETALKKVQKQYKTDIFGFGDALYRKKPGIWKTVQAKWEEMFPDIEVRPEVKVTMWRVGQMEESITPEEVY
jgi:spore germination protein KC